MKKKQIAKLAVTLGLVGAVGVGGTLAILSQKTDPVVNTFAVGDGITAEDISIDETDVEAEGWNGAISDTVRDARNNYTVIPGSKLVKDPQVHVTAESADCYVFIQVHNVDEFAAEVGNTNVTFTDFGANGQWVKVPGTGDGYDAVYYYRATDEEASEGGTKVSVGEVPFNSPKVFTGIELTKDAAVYDATTGEGKENLPKIQVKAAAVQATELETSWSDALEVINNNFEWGNYES